MYIKTFSMYRTLLYNLSISGRFKVEFISKGINFTNGISIEIFIREFVYLMILKFLDITDMQNQQKIFESKK